jgi:hypothetical protein
VKNHVCAAWKWSLSLLKRDWELSDCPVGSWLDMCTTNEVKRLESDTDVLEEGTATDERQLLQ